MSGQREYGNGFGIAGLLIALVCLILVWVLEFSTILAVSIFILNVLGIIFSIIQMRRKNGWIAITGLILNLIALILILLSFFTNYWVGRTFNSLEDQTLNEIDNKMNNLGNQ
ncbi:MAG: hypothetical protein AABX48_03390 [Nanoarchaeota archaeon]